MIRHTLTEWEGRPVVVVFGDTGRIDAVEGDVDIAFTFTSKANMAEALEALLRAAERVVDVDAPGLGKASERQGVVTVPFHFAIASL